MFILLLILIYCADLDRDNPLDPKNPGSSVNRAILVELFVNDSTGFEYCNYALDAIEQLAQREDYRDKLFVLEYHLTNHNANWNDIYASDEFNQRYYEYVPRTSERGIPDAMFNGSVDRVQGASREKIDERYTNVAQALIGQESFFRIDAEKNISNNNMLLDVVVARYGRSAAKDIDLNVILYEDLKAPRHRFVVRKIFQKQSIPFINRGEMKSCQFSEPLPAVEDIDNLYALIFLQHQTGSNKEVFQVAKF